MADKSTFKAVRRCIARGYDQATRLNHNTKPEQRNWRKLLLDTITRHLVSSQDITITNTDKE